MKKYIKSNCFISISISTLFLLICLIFIHPFYDQADDYYMALGLSNGDKILFINYFLGVFVSFLQGIFENINVFSIIQIIISFLLMIISNNIFLSRYKKAISLPIVFLFDTIIAANHFCKIGFTQLSSLCVCIGTIVIMHGIIYNRRIYVVSGITIMVVGSFFRFDNIFVGFLFLFFGLFIYYIIYSFILKKRITFKRLVAKDFMIRVYLPIILLILLVFGFENLSKHIYNTDSSFRQYSIQNNIRSSVEDYPILNYEDNKKIYSNIGLSENDYKMILSWKIDGAFDNSSLEKLANESKSLRPNMIHAVSNFIITSFREMINLSDVGVLILLLIFTIIIYLVFFKLRYAIFPLFISIAIGILNSYLFYIQRYPYRITYGIWLSAIFILIYLFKFCEMNRLGSIIKFFLYNSKLKILPLVFSISLCAFYSLTYYFNFNQFFVVSDNSKLFEYIDNSKKNFVIIGENYDIRNSSETYKNPLTIANDIYLKKCVSWGMVYYNTPFYKDQLERFGISNLYWDLIDNKDILLIDNINSDSVNMMVKYFNEHGTSRITYSLVNQIDRFGIFEITTDK